MHKQASDTNEPRINWSQLLQLSPKTRNEWGQLASIRQNIIHIHYSGIVWVNERKDIWPTILVTIKDYIVKNTLVDSSARISIVFYVLISKLEILISRKLSTKVAVVDGGSVPWIGMIEDVTIFEISIFTALHVIPLKEPSYSLVLGRPLMQALNVFQDWSNCLITWATSESGNILYNMLHQWVIKVRRENNSS